LSGSPAAAQEASKPAAGQPSEEEMMKQMMALAGPGEEHKALDRLVGTWNATIRMWMGPGEPTVSKGIATYEWILGGRYLKSKHTSEIAGMPFEGMGIDGYDRAQKFYYSLWFDTMGTGYMSLKGSATPDRTHISYTGMMFDPAANREVKVREEVEWVDANKFVFSMYSEMPGPDGKPAEMKVMEMTATRQ
jgi:hypothetical protein